MSSSFFALEWDTMWPVLVNPVSILVYFRRLPALLLRSLKLNAMRQTNKTPSEEDLLSNRISPHDLSSPWRSQWLFPTFTGFFFSVQSHAWCSWNRLLTVLFEGIALVLTIPELALLVVFTRHTISQDSIYTFEIVGLVTSSLTLLLLPVLCVISLLWPPLLTWCPCP